MAKVSDPHSILQHPSSSASRQHGRGPGCPSPVGTQGDSDQQYQVSAGTFPGLSLSCHRARGLLKNLFYSSRHGGGNDGWCLWQHLSSLGLGDFSASACVQPAPGVEHRSLSAPGMEVRAWDGSRLPPPTLSLVPTISLAPCPKGRLGCSALLHEGAWGGEGFLCHNSSTRDPVEFTTLLLNIGEYPSIHLSQCTAAGTK